METEVEMWKEEAAYFARGQEYYRGLLDEIGSYLGPEVFVCDDGTISQDILRAKIPELVAKLVKEKNGNS